MATVTLKWTDTNYGESEHRVYRSDAPMDPQALPAVLGSKGPGATSFVDDTAVDDATYYYRVSAIVNGNEYLGAELEVVATPVTMADVLFTAAEVGAVLNIQRVDTLFQDDAATQPVTADGQEVAVVHDVSGNNNHAWQDTAAKRPIYRTDGTFHWLDLSGGRWLKLGNHTITDLNQLIVYDLMDEVDGLFFAEMNSGGNWNHVFQNENGTSVASDGSTMRALHVNGEAVTSFNRLTFRNALLGGKKVSTWRSSLSSPRTSDWVFGEYGSSTPGQFDLDGRLYLMVWRSAEITTPERQEAEQLAAAITGVTLA